MDKAIKPKEARDQRRSNEMSQYELAQKTGIAQAELSLFERGLKMLSKDKLNILTKFWRAIKKG